MPRDADFRRELGQQLRVDSVRCSHRAGSGHPTSSMSAADLMAVLLDGHLQLDFADPGNPANDHLIFSKGHASPLYYSMLKAAGAITDEELMTFRAFGSRLEGHPTPRIPPTDVATGSLGQGLPIGVGIALAGRRLDRLPYRVWVLCGDSEMAEGSMWEAFQYAAWAGLDNLTAIVDVNRLGQANETMLGWDLDGYRRRLEAFGWQALEVDGHDVDAVDRAYEQATSTTGRPTAVIARTVKGKGVKAVEDQPGKHGQPIEDAEAAIEELGGPRHLVVRITKPKPAKPHVFDAQPAQQPAWEVGDQIATRAAFGQAVTALGKGRGDVVVLDGEVSNSTGSDDFRKAIPDRFFEMFIAEQLMVASAVGMQARSWVPFASTFAAFFSRAYDFVRMAAVSRADLCLVGSHAGVSIGEDGPSQMALEDMAALRAIHSSTVLHPSDANQVAKLVPAMAELPGIRFLRTLRGKTTVRTPADEDIRVGGSRVVVGAEARDAAVIACGATVDQAVRAAEALAGAGIGVRVLDCYSVKPIDAAAVRQVAAHCGAVVTVEDHAPEGGLGDAVLDVLAGGAPGRRVVKLAVRDMPVSGKPDELLRAAQIDAEAIAGAVRGVLHDGNQGNPEDTS